MSAPILTDVEMTVASCGYSKPYQNREVFEDGFMTGARFALAAAEARLAKEREVRAQLVAAASETLSTLRRQLASEEACGSPVCGDDEHEAIRLLNAALLAAKEIE